MSKENLLVPVGYYCGPFFTDPEDFPDYWQVRIGRATFELPTYDALNMWFQARGVVGDDNEIDHGRESVVAAAEKAGVRGARVVLNQLMDAGLVIEIGSADWPLERFCSTYSLQPLMVGIGNLSQNQDKYLLGLDQAHVYTMLDDQGYDVWVWTHLSRTIHDAAEDNMTIVDSVTIARQMRRLCRVGADLVTHSAAYFDLAMGVPQQLSGATADDSFAGVPPIPPVIPPEAAGGANAAPPADDSDDYDDGF